MAIRNIVKEGDPILNKVCRPVTNFDDRLATLLDDMRETMIDADGVGLAGPQVGMMRRLFVVWDTTNAPEEIPEDYEYKFIDFVNPEILAVSEEEETAYEGCLSFPGHNGAVTRPVAVKVRAQDRNGDWYEYEGDEILARCFLHEIDHLDGHMYTEIAEKMLTPEELEELTRQEFLLTERGMSYRDALDQCLAAQGLEIHPYLELGSAAQLCQMVERGMGLSFLPEYIVRPALAAGTVARLNVPECQLQMHRQLFYHRDKWLTPQMKVFIELVRQSAPAAPQEEHS